MAHQRELVEELSRLREAEEALRNENEELLEAQGLLEEARDDFSEIHDLAPLPLLTLTRSGVIRSANFSAAELLDEERSQLVGRPFLDLCAAASRADAAAFLAGSNASGQHNPQVTLALHDGSAVSVELRLRFSARKPGVVHLTLVSHADASDEMVARLSHELRTPLAPALAIASKMSRTPTLSADLRGTFRIIERNLAAETRLIDDLLDATCIAHGKLRLGLGAVEVHGLLQQCIDDAERALGDKQLVLHFQPGAARSAVKGDRLRLKQVFDKLLDNAIKFTPARGELHVSSHNSGSAISVEISDSGLGFSLEQVRRLFQPFEQLEQRRPGSGLGLGLTICKGLVELHGGTIRAESAGPGQGARFCVALPLAMLEDAGMAPERQKPGLPTPPERSDAAPRHRILLIEDHEDTLEVMVEILEEQGYAVVPAKSCQEALAVGLENVDVIVSDLGLPDGSALELLPKLRATRRVPALVLSGYGMPSDVAASKEAGFERHLTKPVDFRQLLEALTSLLAQAPAEGNVG